MVSLCEVGGHKQGLEKSIVRAQDLVSQVLTRHYKATSCQAYMTTWQAEDEPTDDTSVTLTLVGEPEVVECSFLQSLLQLRCWRRRASILMNIIKVLLFWLLCRMS